MNRRLMASPVLVNLLAALTVGTMVAYALHLFAGLALVGLLGAAVLLILMDRVELGVLFVGIYTPFEEFLLKFFPLSQSNTIRFAGEVFIAGMLCAVLLRNLAQRRRFKMTPIDVPLALFLAWTLISAVANQTPPIMAVLGLRILLRYVLLYYVVVYAGFRRETISLFFKLFLLAAGIQIAIGLGTGIIGGSVRAFFEPSFGVIIGDTVIAAQNNLGVASSRGTPPLTGFISGAMFNRIHFGTFVVMASLVTLGLKLTGWLRSRWTYLFLFLGLIAVVVSDTRQSLLALIAGSIALVFGAGKTRTGLWLVCGLGVILVASGIFANSFVGRSREVGDVFGRWVSAVQVVNWGPAAENNFRSFLLFDVSGRLISRSPLWGLGPGTFGSALSVAQGDPIYDELGVSRWATPETNFVSDVNWVTLLGQVGAVGTAFFALILLSMFFYNYKLLRRSGDSLARGVALGHTGCIVVIVVTAFFNPVFEIRPISVYLWLFGAFAVSLCTTADVAGEKHQLAA